MHCVRLSILSYIALYGGLAWAGGPLDLSRALAFAFEHNPEVAAARHAVAQARARSREARLYPDPTLSIEAEEYRRFLGPSDGLVTYMVRQTIPTGGKRGYAIGVAKGELAITMSELRGRTWAVLARTKESFFVALGARERLAVTRKLEALAREFYDVVSLRVQGGVVAPLEGTRAQVLLAQAQVEVEKAGHAVDAADQALAAVLGIPGTLSTTAVGDLTRRPPLPRLEPLRALGLTISPEIETAKLKEVVARKELGRARARWIPDVELGVGVARDGREPGDPRRYAASISVTVPISGRPRYRAAEARAGIERSRSELASTARRIEADLVSELSTACRAQDQILSFEGRVLPAAREAAALAGAGYSLGKTGYIDVIDAQRSLAQVSLDYVEALVEYHRALARIEGQIAQRLSVEGGAPAPYLDPHGEVDRR